MVMVEAKGIPERPGVLRKAGLVAVVALALLVQGYLPALAVDQSRLPGLAEPPLRLLLALDAGDPSRRDSWRLLTQVARLLITVLPDEEWLGLWVAGERPHLSVEVAPLTPAHRHAALRQVHPQSAGPSAAGPAASLKACLPQVAREKGRGVLVVLRAGRHISAANREDSGAYPGLEEACREHHLPMVAVELGQRSRGEVLRRIALATGGRHFQVESTSGLADACLTLLNHLKPPQMAPVTGQGVLLDPSVRRAAFFLPRRHPSRPIVLSDPRGRKLKPDDLGGRGVWLQEPAFDLVVLEKPRAGRWEVQHPDLKQVRCFLETDLRLEAWVSAGSLRADTCPVVVAGLLRGGAVLPRAAWPATGGFFLEWRSPSGTRRRLELQESPRACGGGVPAGFRWLTLPEPLPTGTWEVQVRAEGPEFCRERLLSFQVLDPRYAAQPETPRRLRLVPAPDAPAGEPLSGSLTVSSHQAGLAGRFVRTPGDGILRCETSRLPAGAYQVAARLEGCDIQGYPLKIRPPAIAVTVPAMDPTQDGPPLSRWARWRQAATQIITAPWVRFPPLLQKGRAVRSLALAGVLAGVVLFGVVLLSLFRRPPTSADAAPAGNQPEGSGGEQLQELRREKAELEARLGEMEGEVRRLLTDQQKLQEELAERSRIIQEKSRLIHELEATIQKASAEARAVQEEYAALYVRSAKEKKALQQA